MLSLVLLLPLLKSTWTVSQQPFQHLSFMLSLPFFPSIPLFYFVAASTVPVQCLDDMEKKHHHPILRASVPRPPSAPPLPSCSGRPCPPTAVQTGTLLPDSLREDNWYNGPWPTQHCSEDTLAGSDPCSVALPPPPLNQASLDDSSRSFPSPPKPSDAMFWEGHSAASNSSSSMGNYSPRSPRNTEWAKPYWVQLQKEGWFKKSIIGWKINEWRNDLTFQPCHIATT